LFDGIGADDCFCGDVPVLTMSSRSAALHHLPLDLSVVTAKHLPVQLVLIGRSEERKAIAVWETFGPPFVTY
jgi:hypothetical protein